MPRIRDFARSSTATCKRALKAAGALLHTPSICGPNLDSHQLKVSTTLAEQAGNLEPCGPSASAAHSDQPGLPLVLDTRRGEVLSVTGGYNQERFQQTRHIQDLDIAIAMQRAALTLLACGPVRSDSLCDLAGLLDTRFRETAEVEDLDEAIQLLREALDPQGLPHPNRCHTLNNLALLLSSRYDQTGHLSDIDEAISMYRESRRLLPFHLNRSPLLSSLGSALHKRFCITSHLANLDEAVTLLREALFLLPAPHSDRLSMLKNLGQVLEDQFKQTGQLADLDEAILLHRDSLKLTPSSSANRAPLLKNLADALLARSEHTGELAGIPEATALLEEALQLVPSSHRWIVLHGLANVHFVRFAHAGQLVHMDTAIVLYREAHESLPASSSKRPEMLISLAGALVTRFNQTRRVVDLDEAIILFREASQQLVETHHFRSVLLDKWASALFERHTATGRSTDLEEAISLYREALALLSPLHAGYQHRVLNLASALSETEQLGDLNEAIALLRESQNLQPSAKVQNGLAIRLLQRSARLHQLADVQEAVTIHSDSLRGLDSSHPKYSGYAGNLALSNMQLYSMTKQPEHLADAMASFRAAVECEAASPFDRFRVALNWAHHADANHTTSALEAYQAAIELLSRLATLDQDVNSRQQVLMSWSDGLARDAAACASSWGQFDKAVELLEQGRAIFWSQALQLRTPFDELRSVAPELAEKLESVARTLDQASCLDDSMITAEALQKSKVEQEVARYRRLNEDWLATLSEVRKLNGFQHFLQARPLTILQHAAANGPIVMLNASGSACSALVITQHSVEHIPIPTLQLSDVASLAHLTRIASTSGSGRSSLSEPALVHVRALVQEMVPFTNIERPLARENRAGRQVTDFGVEPDEIFRAVLRRLWTSVVEPVIRCLKLEKTDSPSRIWWCPTGPFAFLPMHAAGIYGVPHAECISDYAISSYTPTISALLAQPAAMEHPTMLAIIQPKTSGQSALPHTEEELRKIELHVPRQSLIRLGIPGAAASVEQVLAKLTSASIVHLACHGVQHPENPLESALHLDDGQLKVSQIMKQPLPNASLAFLSACQTAMGNKDIPDEVIHLAATLLFAGFRGTVATMWSMADIDGPMVADHFYGYLFKDRKETEGPVDITQAAHALHYAVAKLRASGRPFACWVPFIHLGI